MELPRSSHDINHPATRVRGTRLAERAAKDGKSVEALASELLEKAVAPEREKTFDEILAPFRQEFAESGMTEEEWDAMIEEDREEIWQEKQCQSIIVRALGSDGSKPS